MTSYIAIPDEETDPGAPVTSELMKKLRDNPLHVWERGGTLPIVAGNTIRWRSDPEQAFSSSTLASGTDFSQIGSVRLTFEHKSSNSVAIKVSRIRNGQMTTLATYNSTSSYVVRTLDISVQPYDTITVTQASVTGDGSIRNMRLMTSGMNIFPVSINDYVENSYI